MAGDPVPARSRAGRRAGAVAVSSTAGYVRLLGAGLLAATGAIHLDLYLTGYGSVATIGPLFLLQVVAALVLAAGLAAISSVLLSLAGTLFFLATLGGYVLSLAVGLFGFHEVRTTAGLAAGVVEVAGAAALVAHGALLASRRDAAGADGSAAEAAWRHLAGNACRLLGQRRTPGLSAVTVAAAGGLALGLAFASAPPASAGAPADVVAVDVHGYGTVLGTTGHRSLYLLSSESRGRITCTGGCLSLWPPLLVPDGARPRAGKGVAGTLGVVRLRSGARQLTFNGYPLYTFVGDTGAAEAGGEGIASNGGVWYLVKAGSTAPSASPVRHRQAPA